MLAYRRVRSMRLSALQKRAGCVGVGGDPSRSYLRAFRNNGRAATSLCPLLARIAHFEDAEPKRRDPRLPSARRRAGEIST